LWSYIARRLFAGIIILLVSSFFLFILVTLSGNPLATLMANPHISQATIAAARAELHLNEPILQRYWTWLTGMLHGNFGISTLGQPVGPQLWNRMGVTLTLIIPTIILSAILAVILGVVSAVKQYTLIDHISTGFAYLFYATPVFVLGILLKDFVAVKFNAAVGHTVLYTVGQNTPGTTGTMNILVDGIEHAILPILTLVLVSYASWSRYQRASLLEVLNADYIRLARAKGLSPRRVLYVHALRNALIPVTTVVALDIAGLIGGVVVTEIVYSWNGMGQFFLTGLTGPISPDVNVVMAWLIITAAAVVIFNLIADLLYALLDPRIRYA
jgi:peptide/nickel transport system permease protein